MLDMGFNSDGPKAGSSHNNPRTRSVGGSVSAHLSGVEVVSILERRCPENEEVLAALLVDPNILLTIAALKGEGELYLNPSSPGDAEVITTAVEAWNRHCEKENPGTFLIASPGAHPPHVSAFNFLGFERLTKLSSLPGVPTFESSGGMEAFCAWRPLLTEKLMAAQEEGRLRANCDVRLTFEAGLCRGYPDQALIDFADWVATGREKALMDSGIPYTGLYGESHPNFVFYPEHREDRGIVRHIEACAGVLLAVYTSDWHMKLSSGPTFQAARRRLLKTNHSGFP